MDLDNLPPLPTAEEVALRFAGLEADEALVGAALGGTAYAGVGNLAAVSIARLPRAAAPRREVLARLAECLPMLQSAVGAGWVARAMRTKHALVHAPALLDAFQRIDDETTRWEIGCTIHQMALPELDPLAPRMGDLLREKRFGTGREMLALALPLIKTPTALQIATALIGSDPDIDGHLLAGFNKVAKPVPAAVVEALAKDPRKWVRLEARNANWQQDRLAKKSTDGTDGK